MSNNFIQSREMPAYNTEENYFNVVIRDMRSVCKKYNYNAEDEVLISEMVILADRANTYFSVKLFSLQESDLKKHIIYFSKT